MPKQTNATQRLHGDASIMADVEDQAMVITDSLELSADPSSPAEITLRGAALPQTSTSSNVDIEALPIHNGPFATLAPFGQVKSGGSIDVRK